jgi:hypothetical protein
VLQVVMEYTSWWGTESLYKARESITQIKVSGDIQMRTQTRKTKPGQTVEVAGAAGHLSPLSIAHPKTAATDQWGEMIRLGKETVSEGGSAVRKDASGRGDTHCERCGQTLSW